MKEEGCRTVLLYPHAYKPCICFFQGPRKGQSQLQRHPWFDGWAARPLKQGPGAFIYSTVCGRWLAGQGGDLYS